MPISRVSKIVVLGEPKSKGALFRAFDHALDFPSYFGNNWDALDEVLCCPEEWYEEKNLSLILDPKHLSKDEEKNLVEILEEAMKQWAEVGMRLSVSFGPTTFYAPGWSP